MVMHSSILACRIPQTEESGRLLSMGSQRVRYDLVTKQDKEKKQTKKKNNIVSTWAAFILSPINWDGWTTWMLLVLLVLLSHFSRVRLLVTPWTAAYKAPPSMGFSRQEYWSGVPLPSPTWMLVLGNSLIRTDHWSISLESRVKAEVHKWPANKQIILPIYTN